MQNVLSGLTALTGLRELRLLDACLLPAVDGLQQLTRLWLGRFSSNDCGQGRSDHVYLQHIPLQLQALQLTGPLQDDGCEYYYEFSDWSRDTTQLLQLGHMTALTAVAAISWGPPAVMGLKRSSMGLPAPEMPEMPLALTEGDMLPPNLQVLHASTWGDTPPFRSLVQLQELDLDCVCTGPTALSDLAAGLPRQQPQQQGEEEQHLQVGLGLYCAGILLRPAWLQQVSDLQCQLGVQLTRLSFDERDCCWGTQGTLAVGQVGNSVGEAVTVLCLSKNRQACMGGWMGECA